MKTIRSISALVSDKATRILTNTCRVAVLAWLFCHCLLTVMYNFPVNPVKAMVLPILNLTIGTFFQQNWSLFAPDPLTTNFTLLVRPITDEEYRHVTAKTLPTTGWYDMSMPLIRGLQRNRFSCYDRISRTQTNSMLLYLNGGPLLTPWEEACSHGDTGACTAYNKALASTRPLAIRSLRKIGSAFCKSMDFGPDVHHFALRIRNTGQVEWSQRYTGKHDVTDTNLGLFQIDDSVDGPHLWGQR
jgi:hypothetical protein